MLLPAVSELLARVARHPAVDETIESLRRGSPEQTIAGLTDPAKALLAIVAASETRRPLVILTDTSRAAEEMVEPLRFFQRALGGGPPGSVALLPALDRLPGEGVGPHPDILETRASTLWRFVTEGAGIVVAPVAASLLSFGSPRL